MQDAFHVQRLRAWARSAWAGVLNATGLLRLARAWVARRGPIVLTFHRVLTHSELAETASLPGMLVTSETFNRFVEYGNQKCEFIDASQEPQWDNNSRLKLAITFDDGWSDNAGNAYPIARKHAVPIVIFLVVQRMGLALPFWPEQVVLDLKQRPQGDATPVSRRELERVVEELKMLSPRQRELRLQASCALRSRLGDAGQTDRTMRWEQVQELQAGGVRFGSHTSTHEILTTISLTEASREISGSRKLLEQALREPCLLFSYPNGNYSAELSDLVRQAGYRYGFSNDEPGIWTRSCNPYQIPRINVSERHLVGVHGKFSPLIFEYKVVWQAAKSSVVRAFRNQVFGSRRPERTVSAVLCPGLRKAIASFAKTLSISR